jgi:peptidoglycan/LPS O-acetylase OafA/YrhL
LVLRTTYLPALEVEGRPLTSDPTAFAANAFLLQGYHPSTLLTGIGPAWSLSVELVFYLALPLLAAGAAFLSSRTGPGGCRPWCAALVPAGLLLLLGQIGWRLAAALPSTEQGSWAGSWHAVVARSFLAHAGLFAMGLVLAVLHAQLERGAVRLPAGWRLVSALGAVSLIAVAALALDRHRLSENHATLAMSAGAACLLALVVLDGGNRLVHVLSSRLLHSAGLISYGIFLWNEPVVWFLRRQGWTSTGVDGFLLALLMTSVLAATLALLSWRLVERPAMALKRAGGGRVRPTDVPGSTAAVIASAVPSPRRSSVSSDDRLATD